MKHLTDGRISTLAARSMGTRAEIRRLVEVGLWLEVDDGYIFHAWKPGDRQPTADEVKERHARTSEERSRAGKLGASKRWQTDGKDIAKPMAEPNGKRIAPARPDLGSGLGGGTRERPDDTCPRHPQGTDDPCRPCGKARKAAEAWDEARKAAKQPPRADQECPHHPGQPAGNCGGCRIDARIGGAA
jgi:hypothetical protein